MEDSLQKQADALITSLVASCCAGHDFGNMSPSIYDTAWLSMLRKPECSETNGSPWLFPECFNFVLAQQQPSGGWQSYATPFDGIINTSAALLSLRIHLRVQSGHEDWARRSQRAEKALIHMLSEWDMNSTEQVGFETLMISLLGLLETEGVVIRFPQLERLRAIRDAKMSRLPLATLNRTASTLHHSLEGFIGQIDFDGVSKWLEPGGSMMGSPASTAAYLMHSSNWDSRAEEYLRKVLERSNPHEHGSVPAAWPTSIFETSWIISTFASAGLLVQGPGILALGKFLKERIDMQDGVLGFAPHMFADVDDTAKTLEALHHLGVDCSVRSLVQTYESSEHFVTYPGERNPSLSANCNVLIALLLCGDANQHLPQIAKAAKFLTDVTFKGQTREKWHTNELYWMVYLTRAFSLLFSKHAVALGVLNLDPSLQEKVPMVCLHILARILHTQQADGSWDGVCELTSYAVLALSALTKLPWIRQIDEASIGTSMAQGKSFLEANRLDWGKGHHMWIEKVTFASDVLSEAYCLAASKIPLPTSTSHIPRTSCPDTRFIMPEKLLMGIKKASALMEKTPLISRLSSSQLRIAELQAGFTLQLLQRQPPDIFPMSGKSEGTHVFIVPLALTTCAISHGCVVSPSVLYEMTVLSILNFQADEFMEGVVEKNFGSSLDTIRSNIRHAFAEFHLEESNAVWQGNGDNVKPTSRREEDCHELRGEQPTFQDVTSVLHSFMTHMLCHEAVQSSPLYLKAKLEHDLEDFFLAHVAQAEHNHRFRTQSFLNDANSSPVSTRRSEVNGTSNTRGEGSEGSAAQYNRPRQSFYHWVHRTSADHTSCPFSFVFFNCLIHTAPSTDHQILTSARTIYLAEDVCRHLASLCRIYNDLGSAARDADEGTVNSLNFPEFFFRASRKNLTITKQKLTPKEDLLWIAEYERQSLNVAMVQLERELGDGHLSRALHIFIDVTDLYGQIYILQDIGIRTG